MLIAPWPIIFILFGLLLWCWPPANGKPSEIGKWMLIIGMFWLCYSLTGKTLRLG